MAEDRTLPGTPKKRDVLRVKRQLASFGIRPTMPRLWYETWAWANEIAWSYATKRWPLPNEIAAQYILLLMVEMKGQQALKLPYRAGEQVPEPMRPKLKGNPLVGLPAPMG